MRTEFFRVADEKTGCANTLGRQLELILNLVRKLAFVRTLASTATHKIFCADGVLIGSMMGGGGTLTG